ncbi:Ig-like domain-containing protein [Fervidobacterium sp.]
MKKAVFLTIGLVLLLILTLSGCTTPPNRPPVWKNYSYTKTATVNQELTFDLTNEVSDPDGDPVTISIVGETQGATITGKTFKFTPTSSRTFTFTLKASDGKGGEAYATLVVIVNPVPNSAPVWNLPEDGIQIQKGQSLNYALEDKVTDPDGDEVTITIESGPAGASLTNKTLTWSTASVSEGLYIFLLKATDSKGAFSFGQLRVSVVPVPPTNRDPSVLPVPEQIANVGKLVTINLGDYAYDPDGDALTFTVKSGPGYIIGKKYYWFPKTKFTDAQNVTIEVSDGKGGIANLTFKVKAPYDGTGSLIVYVTDYKSGAAVGGATVELKAGNNTVATTNTDETGKALFSNVLLSSTTDFDIVIKKDGHARTYIEGLRLRHAETVKFETQLRVSRLGPTTSDKPFELEFEIYDANGNILLPDSNLTTDTVRVVGQATSTEYTFNLWYVKVGGVPGTGVFTNPRAIGYSGSILATQSAKEFEGMTPVLIDVYDQNDNRYEKIVYINVIRQPVSNIVPYIVQKYTTIAPTSYNILAYTRNQAIEFYKKGINPTAAGKGQNLYIEVRWRPWYSASGTAMPKAYRIYRSFDNVTYEPIATVPYNYYYYRDYSAELEPLKKVYYAVSSVYDGFETPYTVIGDVIPLRMFDVVYESPVNGSTNVPRDPTFKWTFDGVASTEEGTVTYLYDIWLYDLVVNDYCYYSIGTNPTSGSYSIFLTPADSPTVEFKFSEFTSGAYRWIDFASRAWYPYDKLQANKVYEWGNELLVARVIDSNDRSVAYAIKVDDSGFIDPWGVKTEIYHRFVTGEN